MLTRTTAALSLTLMALVAFNPLTSAIPFDDEVGELNSNAPAIHLQNHQGPQENEQQNEDQYLAELAQSALESVIKEEASKFTAYGCSKVCRLRRLLPSLSKNEFEDRIKKLFQSCLSLNGVKDDSLESDPQQSTNIWLLKSGALSYLLSTMENVKILTEEDRFLILNNIENMFRIYPVFHLAREVGSLESKMREPNISLEDILEAMLVKGSLRILPSLRLFIKPPVRQ